MLDGVGASLLISQDAPALAAFYRDTLELPLVDEVHEGVPAHYGCELGSVHFAIHPSETWPGEPTDNALSPVLVFNTADAAGVYEKLQASKVPATPPFDHGFGNLVAFRDPDGNNVQVMQPAVSPNS